MILICRDCHATVKFGEDCACGGTVELAKTQMDELLFRAWQYQKLQTLYREFGPDFVPEEAIRVSAVSPGAPAENAERASGAANISGEVLAAPQER
jgi:hypothetical protein